MIGAGVQLLTSSHAGGITDPMPQNIIAPSMTGNGLIGSSSVLDFGSWTNATGFSAVLRQDGVVLASGLTDGQSFTWTAAHDASTMILEVTATGPGGQLVASSQPLYVTYAAPVVTGSLSDEIYDEDSGVQTVNAALVFNGQALVYSVSGMSATVDPITGIVSIPTDQQVGATLVTVQATNSGGFVTESFYVTVEGLGGGAPDVLYYSSFAADQSADPEFDSVPASFVHDPGVSFAGDDVNGAMRWGDTSGESNATCIIRVPVAPNRQHQVLIRSTYVNNGNINPTYVELFDASGGSLWNAGDVGAGEILLTVPPHASASYIQFFGRIKGANTGGSLYWLHEFGVWDITSSGGFPGRSTLNPMFWAEQGYVGTPMPSIDVASAFTGAITSYSYDGPEPHSWAGSFLTITPGADTGGRVSRSISALNNTLESVDTLDIEIVVDADPGTMIDAGVNLDWTIEAGRPIPAIDFNRRVSNAAFPLSFAVNSKPSWVTIETNGVAHGRAPSSPEMSTLLSVDVTDARGQVVTITAQFNIIAERDRNPVDLVTINPGTTVRDAVLANPTKRMFKLADGNHIMGNDFNLFNGADQANPYVIWGGPGAVFGNGIGSMDSTNENLILQGFTLGLDSAGDGDTKDDMSRDQIAVEQGANHVYLYDLTVQGNTISLGSPITPDVSTNSQGKFWRNDAEFVFNGNGLGVGGFFGVAHNCTISDVYDGLSIRDAYETTVEDCIVQNCGIDGFIVTVSEAVVVKGCASYVHQGNYHDGTHRDLIQTFHNNDPKPKRHVFIDNFVSTGGMDEVQGHLLDSDGFSGSSKTLEDGTNHQIIFRNHVAFASTGAHGMELERYTQGTIERAIVLPHPETTNDAHVNFRFISQITLSDSLYHGMIGNGDALDQSLDLSTISGSIDMEAGGAPAFADIFPNWNATGLTYEDPRHAVANGQPASAARFWIDPAGTWNTTSSNAAIGPSWLRDGVS